MKSPFTGGETKLVKEIRELEYRKEPFDIYYHYYVCIDTREQFTTTELDTLNITQVHNKYRSKYGIPFVDEIKSTRERYGLSAARISEVLGLGVNVYRNYESGEMPSVATGRLIRLAEDPGEFIRLLELSKNVLEPAEYIKVKRKIEQAVTESYDFEKSFREHWLGSSMPNLFNGYKVPDLKRIGAMVQYFSFENKPFLTALNKLMFYSDFFHFKCFGFGISGLVYKALPKGPVPNNYWSIYNQVINEGVVKTEEMNFGDYVGDRFVSNNKIVLESDDSLFNESETKILRIVSNRFKGMSTKQIVDISHKEAAWIDNVDDVNRISFEYAFDLIYPA